MAGLRTEASSNKAFFNNTSHALKKFVNAFPKQQRLSSQFSEQLHTRNILEKYKRQAEPSAEFEVDEHGNHPSIVATSIHGNHGYKAEPVHIRTCYEDEEELNDHIEYRSSIEGALPRPSKCKNLNPHDFSAWEKSPSITRSTSREVENISEVLSDICLQERHVLDDGRACGIQYQQSNSRTEHLLNLKTNKSRNRANISEHGSPIGNLTMASSPVLDLHLQEARQRLPDLKLEVGVSSVYKHAASAGLQNIPDDRWSIGIRASDEARRRSVDSSCWKRQPILDPTAMHNHTRDLIPEGDILFQKSVDESPFIESYRDCQNNQHRNNFQHHASMVYTRAPSRENLAKKVGDGAHVTRTSRSGRIAKKNCTALEEQENEPRRLKDNEISCSPQRASHESSVEIAKLKKQVHELQSKLFATEGTLRSHHDVTVTKSRSSEMQLLLRKLDELHVKIAEKDQLLESVQNSLSQKENEIETMRQQLQSTEETCAELKAQCINDEEEVRTLKCELALLRWQAEVDAVKQNQVSLEMKEMQEFNVRQSQEKKGQASTVMEAVRKKYLAALIVAKNVPSEECLALVRLLRAQLQCIARIPPMSMLS